MSLPAKALARFLAGSLILGLLIFLPAGTLRFANGWLFLALLLIPMFIVGLVMLKKAPALLKSRLDSKEKQGEQRQVIALSGLMFLSGFILAGLDYRFGWTALPDWAVLLAVLVFLLGYVLYAEVLRENAWLSRTVQVQEGQQVVDTGLYGVVRHPMYLSTLLLFLSMPLVLGSGAALVPFLLHPFLMAKRIRSEEALLRQKLPGYEAYTHKVRYRMIPLIW